MSCIFAPMPGMAACPQWEGLDRCWLGVGSWFGDPFGNWEGCDVGCFPCMDNIGGGWYPGQSPFPALGLRYMRADPVRPSRNAYGEHKDLRSVNVTPNGIDWNSDLVPLVMHYTRATCWDNFGRECWDHTSCDCYPDPNVTASAATNFVCVSEGLGLSTPIGQPVRGYQSDLWGFMWDGWRIVGTSEFPWIKCRRFEDDTARHTVQGRARSLTLPMVFHTGGDGSASGVHPPATCTTNPLAGCLGQAPASPCQSGYGSGQPDPVYYAPIHIRNEWSEVLIAVHDDDERRPHLRKPFHEGDYPQEEAMLDIQNAAIRHVLLETFPRYSGGGGGDVMDFRHVDFQDHANGQELDRWARWWDLTGATELTDCAMLEQPAPDGTLIATLPDCRTQVHGLGVTVKMFLTNASIRLGFVPVFFDGRTWPGADSHLIMAPFVRLFIDARIGYRAYLHEPSEEVTILNVGDPGHPGTVPLEEYRTNSHWFDDFHHFGQQTVFYTFTDLPAAVGDVTIKLRVEGDFGDWTEYVSLRFAGSDIIHRLFDEGDLVECDDIYDEVVVSADVWNAMREDAENDIGVFAWVSAAVDSTTCESNRVKIYVAYQAHAEAGEDCELPPVIEGDNLLIRKDGVLLNYPPRRARWRGFLGTVGERTVVDHLNLEPGESLGSANNFCHNLNEKLMHVFVPGWPTQLYSKPDDPNSIYAGGVRLRFND